MTERETRIIAAAVQLFSQYGFKRTTMNDIAVEAAVARQTLYNSFANKEEVLLGCIRALMAEQMSTIKTGATKCDNAGTVLDIILEAISLKPYRMLAQTRHADEIIGGYSRFPTAEKAENNRQLIAVIEQVLQPYQQHGQQPGQQHGLADGPALHELAEFIHSSAYSAKQNARDETHLMTLLNTLKLLVLKGL